MYQTCVVHAPIPCKVIDQDDKLYAFHDRYFQGDFLNYEPKGVTECPEEGTSPENT